MWYHSKGLQKKEKKNKKNEEKKLLDGIPDGNFGVQLLRLFSGISVKMYCHYPNGTQFFEKEVR